MAGVLPIDQFEPPFGVAKGETKRGMFHHCGQQGLGPLRAGFGLHLLALINDRREEGLLALEHRLHGIDGGRDDNTVPAPQRNIHAVEKSCLAHAVKRARAISRVDVKGLDLHADDLSALRLKEVTRTQVCKCVPPRNDHQDGQRCMIQELSQERLRLVTLRDGLVVLCHILDRKRHCGCAIPFDREPDHLDIDLAAIQPQAAEGQPFLYPVTQQAAACQFLRPGAFGRDQQLERVHADHRAECVTIDSFGSRIGIHDRRVLVDDDPIQSLVNDGTKTGIVRHAQLFSSCRLHPRDQQGPAMKITHLSLTLGSWLPHQATVMKDRWHRHEPD